jgi:hypothetical protein
MACIRESYHFHYDANCLWLVACGAMSPCAACGWSPADHLGNCGPVHSSGESPHHRLWHSPPKATSAQCTPHTTMQATQTTLHTARCAEPTLYTALCIAPCTTQCSKHIAHQAQSRAALARGSCLLWMMILCSFLKTAPVRNQALSAGDRVTS